MARVCRLQKRVGPSILEPPELFKAQHDTEDSGSTALPLVVPHLSHLSSTWLRHEGRVFLLRRFLLKVRAFMLTCHLEPPHSPPPPPNKITRKPTLGLERNKASVRPSPQLPQAWLAFTSHLSEASAHLKQCLKWTSTMPLQCRHAT